MKKLFSLFLICFLLTTVVPQNADASSSTSLISSAKSYIGTPYRSAGTTPSGFDCSGFTQYVFKQNGVTIPRVTSSQFSAGTPVSKSNLQSGDLVFFNTSGNGVSHVGIYIASSKFIHASTSQGVMISSINDPAYWGNKYMGARRLTSFADETTAVKQAVPKIEEKYATRGEIAEILAEKLQLDTTETTSVFTDVTNEDPNSNAIFAVASAGIFSGNDLGEFNPNDPLTRAQLAKVLVEAFKLQGKSDYKFNDVSDTYWASGYIKTLYYNDITTGYSNGDFGINDKVTVNQFKLFMNRISQ